MSHSLLSQPEKPHDITDDLESLFWVLVYGAMKWHSLPDQYIPFEGFDQYNLDGQGRRIGGDFKSSWILSGDTLVRLRLTSPTLHKLIKDCRLVWWKFYNAKEGARDFEDMEVFHAEIMKTLGLAGKPVFWIERYSAILSTWDAPPPPPIAPAGPSSNKVPLGANSLPVNTTSQPETPTKSTTILDSGDATPGRRGVKRSAESISSGSESVGALPLCKRLRRGQD